MVKQDIFSWVKSNVVLSEYVDRLPECNGLKAEGGGRFRTNNVVDGGSDSSAMVIDDNNGLFKCWSKSHSSGDVIKLFQIMSPADITPKEAAIGVANFMGVKPPESLIVKKSGTPRRDMIDFMNSLAQLLNKRLDGTPQGDYLNERGLDIETASKWKLGAFPETQRECRDIVKEALNGKSKRVANDAGVMKDDFIAMQGRLSFPIMNRSGDVIAFSSRIIPNSSCFSDNSKYINTRATSIYDKSSTLYGEHLIGQTVDSIYICEGNFDVIALNEVLPDGAVAVAVCGTALTEGHAKTLSATRKIVLSFDDDDAGRNATRSSVWLLNQANMSVLVLPDGADPWDWFISDRDDFTNALTSNRVSFNVFAIESATKDLSDQESMEWIKHSYSRLGRLDTREDFKRSAKRLSGFTSNVIDDILSGLVAKAVSGDSSKVSFSAMTTVSALMWLTKDEKAVILGKKISSQDEFEKFADSWLPLSNGRDMDAASAAALGLEWSGDNDVVNDIQALYPNSEKQGEDAIRSMTRSVFGRIIDSFDSSSSMLDESLSLDIIMSKISSSVYSGMLSENSREALCFAIEAIDSFNYESLVAEKKNNA